MEVCSLMSPSWGLVHVCRVSVCLLLSAKAVPVCGTQAPGRVGCTSTAQRVDGV